LIKRTVLLYVQTNRISQIKTHDPPGTTTEPTIRGPLPSPTAAAMPPSQASPLASPRLSIHTHHRRKSSVVVDEGQADILAISSRPTSMSSTIPLAIGSIKQELASNASSRLQVPQIDSQGRNVTSSTASIKSGTVGEGGHAAAVVNELFVAKKTRVDSLNGAPVAASETKKGSEETAVADPFKDQRPAPDRFYAAQESISSRR
jgi:hypothetical protein